MYVPVCLGCAGCDPLDHQGCTVELHVRGRPNFVVNCEMVPVMTLILSVDTHSNKGVQVRSCLERVAAIRASFSLKDAESPP